jgi:hypothetical protein
MWIWVAVLDVQAVRTPRDHELHEGLHREDQEFIADAHLAELPNSQAIEAP